MTSILYGVSTVDPLAFGATGAVVGLVALAACTLAARKAAKVDPLAALRCE